MVFVTIVYMYLWLGLTSTLVVTTIVRGGF